MVDAINKNVELLKITSTLLVERYITIATLTIIKIKILETCPTSLKETAELVAQGTGAEVVQTIGLKIVLFRVSDNEKNRTINIDKIR